MSGSGPSGPIVIVWELLFEIIKHLPNFRSLLYHIQVYRDYTWVFYMF